MDKLKAFNAIKVILICIMLAALFTAPSLYVAHAEGESSYVLYENTKLYSDDTLSEVIAELPQNALVEIKFSTAINGKNYYRVDYNGLEGYVYAKSVYEAKFYDKELKIKSVLCIADKVGKSVNVYAEPSEDAEVLYTLTDGARLEISETDREGFYRIINESRGGYISESNVTRGLSRNYRVALAIGGVCIVMLVSVFSVIYVRRNKEYIQTHKTNRIKARQKVQEDEMI